jgi:hypothetical protein
MMQRGNIAGASPSSVLRELPDLRQFGAELAGQNPEFAQELPHFMAEIKARSASTRSAAIR